MKAGNGLILPADPSVPTRNRKIKRAQYTLWLTYNRPVLTMKSKYMNPQKIINTLKHKEFIKVVHQGTCFENGAAVYAKEIRENIFLLFIILKDIEIENIQALIAHFDCF